MNTTQKLPRITVILPTHNRPVLLAEAIASVRSQTYEGWDLIVVDDASEPPAIVPEDSRIELIRNECSCGGAESKNVGVRRATGELIAFLDDDDLYAPTYLERAVAALAKSPAVDGVFMGVSWFGERAEAGQGAYEYAMRALMKSLSSSPEQDGVITFERAGLFRGLLRTVPMAFQRPVFRRASFERVGFYQSDILLWDCDWAIRAALDCNCALVVDGLYMQRAEGQGYSSNRDRRGEHLSSNALMKERLLERDLTDTQRTATRNAIADLWFDAAWSSARSGARGLALKYLKHSATASPRFAQLRLFVRVLAGKR